jgi:hypothetical protein
MLASSPLAIAYLADSADTLIQPNFKLYLIAALEKPTT